MKQGANTSSSSKESLPAKGILSYMDCAFTGNPSTRLTAVWNFIFFEVIVGR